MQIEKVATIPICLESMTIFAVIRSMLVPFLARRRNSFQCCIYHLLIIKQICVIIRQIFAEVQPTNFQQRALNRMPFRKIMITSHVPPINHLQQTHKMAKNLSTETQKRCRITTRRSLWQNGNCAKEYEKCNNSRIPLPTTVFSQQNMCKCQ